MKVALLFGIVIAETDRRAQERGGAQERKRLDSASRCLTCVLRRAIGLPGCLQVVQQELGVGLRAAGADERCS